MPADAHAMPDLSDIRFEYHVFVSHNQAQKPWVRQLVERLREDDLRVFFDEDIALGENIVLAIENALVRSRHVVLVLSQESLASRWVALEWATTLYRDPSAASRFLIPVLRSHCELPLSLAGLKRLDATNDDFERQVSELLASIDRTAVAGTPRHERSPIQTTFTITPSPILNPTPGGAIPFDSEFYIHRSADERLLSVLQSHSLLASVTGPRQSGKSSMAIRVASRLRAQGVAVVRVDFQSIGAAALSDVLRNMAEALARAIGLGNIGPSAFAGSNDNEALAAFEKVVSRCERPLVLVLDEVDTLLGLGDDVMAHFLMYVRSHADRGAYEPGWRNVKYLLVLMLDPDRLFAKLAYGSPTLNVGGHIAISGFTRQELMELLLRYNLSLADREYDLLYRFTGGQPFLVHQCGELIAKGVSVASLVAEDEEYLPRFGTHLRPLYYALMSEKGPANEFERLRETGRFRIASLLRYPPILEMADLGLITYDRGADAYVFACELYKRYFLKRGPR
jgi:AAA-like domain/TIR domain